MALSRAAIALLIAILPVAAPAAPSVFISQARGESWWNAVNSRGRVIGTMANGVSAIELSKYIERTNVYWPFKVCALTEVQNDTYVGMDKATQDEINATLKLVHWRLEAVTPDGGRVTAQSVLYESCDDTENRGAALLVTDSTTSKPLLFEPMGPGELNGASIPIWTAFLWKPDRQTPDAPLFSFSACTECGAATAVYYDVTRKKLYTEYNGH